ncbi:hypothetical protein OH76DRAFT_1490175 [Lentinus brumalis]|uniref:F-box domain-containing protein n=1 Tax=Lentinus brumalis TaxID=2498619 RepID=A0A371CJW1_9APHY|nr:hypothetical protein OH76DRAFT_1490175 [Polyporus brumalis]
MDTGTARPLSHEVLFNFDLLHNVFSYLHRPPAAFPPANADEDKPGVEEATLASAARVCRTFTDPALAVLWSSLANFFPLWSLLEPLRTMGETAQPPQEKFKYILTDEISTENWARFCHYAALIREIRLDDISDMRIDHSVWLHLLRKSGGRFPDLFPRLRSLAYALHNPHQTSILLFLSPTLRRLKFYCSWRAADWGPYARQEAAVSMLLRTACTDCPELDDLRLTMLEFPGPLRTAAEGLKHRLRRLELGTLEISDTATIQALADITTLEQLREIHVKFTPTERVAVTGFRALKDLSIICDAAEDVSKFLACVVSPLESLEICSFAPSSAWLEEFGVIVPMVKSLKSFKIELLPEPTGFEPETVHLSHLVEPLFPLRNLEVFSLLVRDTRLVAEDSSFEAIAKAWPRLTSFALDGGLLTSATTLAGLAHFAKHCPSLHTLLLPHLDDAPVISPHDSLPSQGALRRLSFYLMHDMNIHDAEATARTIWRLFPNLDIQGECRRLPIHKVTPANEDDEDEDDEPYAAARRTKTEAGREAWIAVLYAVQMLQIEGAR